MCNEVKRVHLQIQENETLTKSVVILEILGKGHAFVLEDPRLKFSRVAEAVGFSDRGVQKMGGVVVNNRPRTQRLHVLFRRFQEGRY
jgi:hypothetical protein